MKRFLLPLLLIFAVPIFTDSPAEAENVDTVSVCVVDNADVLVDCVQLEEPAYVAVDVDDAVVTVAGAPPTSSTSDWMLEYVWAMTPGRSDDLSPNADDADLCLGKPTFADYQRESVQLTADLYRIRI